tara:strand:- start:1871 stop:2545 length:675 start_codon:yes stop_codon:yes gene_type:complete
MSFFKNNLTSKKYFEILKNNFSKRFILENFGMLLGNKSFYRFLKLSEILLKTKNVKGDIIEFGIWNGNNLFTIKKISDYYDLKKKIYGFDNFSGFPNPPKFKKKKTGKYIGKPKLIKKMITFFNLQKIFIVNDDIMNLPKYRKKFNKISFIYIDCNVFKVVDMILNELNHKISKGGVIAFDEARNKYNKDEGKAMMKFYIKNKKNYKLLKLNANYQPDAILIKK